MMKRERNGKGNTNAELAKQHVLFCFVLFLNPGVYLSYPCKRYVAELNIKYDHPSTTV